MPRVNVSGIVTLPDSAEDSSAVTVTDVPSSTGFGEADRLTVGVAGGGSSLSFTVTDAAAAGESATV